MSYKIIITDHAHEDLRQIMLWYNEQRQALGDEFIIKAEELIDQLKKNPYIYQVRKKEIRYGLFERFPYQAIYEIIKQDVVIYGIVHGHQHPRKIFKRIKKKQNR